MEKLIIYKASAGSGKTYKLTEEYLRLAFKIPYTRILAVTFTNKATAEMKDRITGVLDMLAKGNDSPYLQILMDDNRMDEFAVRDKAGRVLDEILQNYSRFSVGTIDSFFQQVIRGFARETGLQSGFELELDNRRVLEKVIDRLILETSTNDGLRDWMMRYTIERIKDGQSWNFRRDIGRLGNQVFNETFMEFRKEMSEKLSDREFMNNYMASLHSVRNDFEKQMNEFGNSGLALIEQRGLSVSDFIYGAKGVAGYFEKITVGKKQYEPGKRVADAAADTSIWCTRKSPSKTEIDSVVETGLCRILNQAIEFLDDHYPSYVSSKLVLSNIYTLGILNDITRHIREYASENNLFLLSDVASLLAGVIGTNDAPFVYEKTGHFYRHFMIDEFQDTSSIQWKNFVPLITNSLAENNRNILVGDVKQSIYRWRNGDWRILASGIQQDMKIFSPQVRTLEINWRSKRNIVEFNNSLFESGPEIIRDQFHREYIEAGLPEDFAADMVEQIGRAYADQAQELPVGEDKEGGCVNIQFQDNNDGDWKQSVLDNLPQLLTGIRSRGYKLSDMAILVRNKRDGQQIAGALLDWQAGQSEKEGMRLDFISEEFLLIRESTSVRLLLALMTYLIDSSDRINRAVILSEYCRYLQGIPHEGLSDHDLFGSITAGDDTVLEKLLPAEFIPRKGYLRQLSIYELVEQLIDIFGLKNRRNEIPYLMGFQDVVLDYSRKEGGGTGPFIEYWQEHCSSFSVSSNDSQDAMRIMTIHKAKGLQFKIVLIPFGEWNIDHNPLHDNFLWCRPTVKPFNKLDLVPVKYKSELAKSIFARDYFNEKMQVFVDNLNLLYVAFTRAEEELYAFMPLPAEKQREWENVKSISALLYKILADQRQQTGEADGAGSGSSTETKIGHQNARENGVPGQGSWNDEMKLFSRGMPGIQSYADSLVSEDRMVPEIYHVNNFKNKLRLRPYSNLFFSDDQEIGKRIDHGKLMHDIFENIVTFKDIEKAVMQKSNDGIITKSEAVDLIGTISDIASRKNVAHWFDGTWRVRNETAILMKGGKTVRPDRVMIKDDQVIVVDYKFGEQLQPRYMNQVRRYMGELREMGYNNLKGYVWYALNGTIDEVDMINPRLEFDD